MPDLIPLGEGHLVSCRGHDWVIVHCEDFERVLASRVFDGRHEFLPIAELAVTNVPNVEGRPPESRANRRVRKLAADEDSLSDKESLAQEKAVNEFQVALEVIKVPRAERRAAIRQMAATFGYNEATAYRRLKLVRIHGTADALLHAVRSDAGKRRLAAEVVKIVRDHLAAHRFVAEARTLPAVLELVNGALRVKGLKKISLSTLQSFEKETTLKQKLEAQGRKKKAADAFRPKVGHLPNADYPLAIAQVDHTPIQICLVDEEDRQPIDDPWLTLVIDCYSRMVLGFFLSFDPPSTLSTGMALAHAFLPKEEFLRSQGVAGEWPCWGFPDVILVDNATELNGRMMHGARRRYRFTLRDRPVGAPNFGGHVESAFKTFMHEFKSVPGTKFSNPIERGEYDSQGRAIFTIAEFEAFFTEFLVNDYHVRKHTGDGMDGAVPLTKWRQGTFEGDRMPPTGPPPRPADPLSLRISLMPFERRTIRNSTVTMLTHEYHNGRLAVIGDAVDLKKPIDDRLFEVRYDPRNISKVWLYDEAQQGYIELGFADLRKGPISLWEDRARKRRRANHAEQFADTRYESMLRREEMKEQATKKTKQQRLEAEKARRRAAGAIVKPAPPKAPVAPKKKQLDASQIAALRANVRAAVIQPKPAEDPRDDS